MDATVSATRSAGRGAAGTVGAPCRDRQLVSAMAGDHGVWVPNGIKSVHEDTSLVKHQVLITLLPGGVGYEASEDIEVNLEKLGDDTYLTIHVKLPSFVSEGKFLPTLKHTLKNLEAPKWASMNVREKAEALERFNEDFVLMSQAIKKQLAVMRAEPEVATLKATARIKLDFPVKPLSDNDWLLVGEQKGVRLLFTDLKAPKTCSYKKSKVKTVQIAEADG